MPPNVFFLVIPIGQKVYKLHDIATKKIFTNQDVIFLEDTFYHSSQVNPTVARVWRRGKNIHPQNLYHLKICEDKEFLSFISGKMEWESPPSILVIRNPNWSQRSGTGTGCVKGRY